METDRSRGSRHGWNSLEPHVFVHFRNYLASVLNTPVYMIGPSRIRQSNGSGPGAGEHGHPAWYALRFSLCTKAIIVSAHKRNALRNDDISLGYVIRNPRSAFVGLQHLLASALENWNRAVCVRFDLSTATRNNFSLAYLVPFRFWNRGGAIQLCLSHNDITSSRDIDYSNDIDKW